MWISKCAFDTTCPFQILQKWQKELDSGEFIGTILMDLSKAYDCLPHDLLIAKLETYGLDNGSLNPVGTGHKLSGQKTYSKWSNIRRGIPQGSILGSLLFNIFSNDIFIIIDQSDICNFADDKTLYSCGKSLVDILNRFRLNSLKANPRKFGG